MWHSLRIRIFVMMLAVAAVAIGTIAFFASITTQQQFMQYVQFNDTMRAERFEKAVVTFWQGDFMAGTIKTRQASYPANTMGAIHIVEEKVTTNFDILRYVPRQLYNFSYQAPPEKLVFLSMPEGNIQVYEGDRAVGAFAIEATTPDVLIPAQNDFFSSVNQGLVIGAGLAGISALILTIILARTILRPVSALTTAARNMEHGDLTQRVAIKAKGEIGELAKAFNAMAESINHNETLRRHMVSDIAHELRTPLTNIRGYLEAIQDGLVQPDQETIEMIYEEAMLLSHLTQDLQELALAEARKLRIDPNSMSMSDVIRQIVTIHKPQADQKQIELTADYPDDLPDVFADRKRVEQIVRNLVDNAIYYTPNGGTVHIQAKASALEVSVIVRDTGEGIDDEHLPYIFERFYRADPSRSRKTGGAGIGLAIVKELVQAQGGTIQVESKKGKGSTFTFTLPIAG